MEISAANFIGTALLFNSTLLTFVHKEKAKIEKRYCNM